MPCPTQGLFAGPDSLAGPCSSRFLAFRTVLEYAYRSDIVCGRLNNGPQNIHVLTVETKYVTIYGKGDLADGIRGSPGLSGRTQGHGKGCYEREVLAQR